MCAVCNEWHERSCCTAECGYSTAPVLVGKGCQTGGRDLSRANGDRKPGADLRAPSRWNLQELSGQLDVAGEGARESQSGSPMGQIQFVWFWSVFTIKTIKLKLHWVWLALLIRHHPHHSLFTCLVPEGI